MTIHRLRWYGTAFSHRMPPQHHSPLLTAKERSRLVEVTGMLARGENPYTTDEMKRRKKNVTGSRGSINADPREVSMEQVEELERKWQDRSYVAPLPTAIIDDPVLAAQFGEFPPEPPPGKLLCTYCGAVVDYIRATVGKQTVFINIQEEITGPSGEVELRERFVPKQVKNVGCPDCSLKVRGKQEWAESEG